MFDDSLDATTQTTSSSLQERVVSSVQDCFGFRECTDLIRTRFFPHIEILEQPIAFAVQCLDHLQCGHHLLLLRLQSFLVSSQCSFCVCFRTFLLGDGLRVGSTLLCRVFHHLFIVSLGVLLLGLGGRHFLVEIGHQSVQHGDNTVALFSFLLESTRTLRRRRWRNAMVRMHRNADELSLFGFVHFWVVKFVQSVFRYTQQLLRCTVLCHQLRELSILLLPVCGCFCHGLVQSLDARSQAFDFASQTLDPLRCVLDRDLRVRN